MVGYISKYLSYTQSCVGCIGRLVYSSKKTSLWGSPEYTERSMRHWINVGTGCVFSKLILKILVPIKSAIHIVKF